MFVSPHGEPEVVTSEVDQAAEADQAVEPVAEPEQQETVAASPAWAVEARQLRKRYGRLEAVRGVDFSVATAETFGFLGPNGAGKSTTISMLCTLVRPTGGSAEVNGFDVVESHAEVRRRIGLVFQEVTLDDYLTAMENLRLHAELYGLAKAAIPRRAREVLDLIGLWDRRHSLVRTFSGGMKRRLEIARGLLHSPRVLFLDEPTIGLDPQTRAHIWNYINELKRRERVTIFLTTHHMDEAEHCDRIAIIDHGEIVVIDTPQALKASVGKDRVLVRTDDDDEARARLEQRWGIEARADGDGLTFQVSSGEAFVPRLFGELGVPIRSVSVARPTLDDVFMSYTGRTIREAESVDGGRRRRRRLGRSKTRR
ncbi:MAG TPA: ATP-binding cassette domain-containing protein [Acidimicrobiales bacterium]|nr:ATP-binding cassette domain-containing protein [Acidimicrobiales bacterium]